MDNYYPYGVPHAFTNTTPYGEKNRYSHPFNEVELQSSNACPKTYLIFDQTENERRVMFNPALDQNYGYGQFDVNTTNSQYHGYADNQGAPSSSLKEDSDDIDALLNLEDDGEEDDVVSTGRTPCHFGNNSPDSVSCSGCDSRSQKVHSSQNFSDSAPKGKKKERMKKMVKALKGIVPGGNQMDTPAVLDEAVRYLKSLKVEVQKRGIRNIRN